MFNFEQPDLTLQDRQIGAVFHVVAGRVLARNVTKPGFIFEPSARAPLRKISRHLQDQHGLTGEQVLAAIRTASDLVATVHEHVADRLPEDPEQIYN